MEQKTMEQLEFDAVINGYRLQIVVHAPANDIGSTVATVLGTDDRGTFHSTQWSKEGIEHLRDMATEALALFGETDPEAPTIHKTFDR